MPDREAGYATAAAIFICLGLALIVTALTSQSVLTLRRAKSALRQTQIDMAISGAQLRASLSLVQASSAGRIGLSLSTDLGPVAVLAEREQDKVLVDAILSADDLKQFKLPDPPGTLRKLQALKDQKPSPADIEALASSDVWKLCAPSLISAFGAAKHVQLASPAILDMAPGRSKLGEVWRLRARMSDGWTDDRTIRFTGNANAPSVIIWRRLIRRTADTGQCESMTMGTKP